MEAMIWRRDLTGAPVSWRGLTHRVNSLEWQVLGGSRAASVTLFGSEGDLWEALQWLRCPMVVWDEQRRMAWCGYVNEAQVRIGAVEVRVGLTTMVNRVAVAYSYVPPGGEMTGARLTTAWAEDAESIAEFGYKEYLKSAAGMTPSGATALRDAVLAAQRWPQSVTVQSFGASRGRLGYSGAEESQSATLYCVGWWQSLDWRLADVPLIESVSYTTNNANRLLGYSATYTACGQQVTISQAVNITEIEIYAYKTGAPVDNLRVGIYEVDASGYPTGSALATASIGGASLTTSLAWYTLALSAEVPLVAGRMYAIQFDRSGALSSTNYYRVGYNSAGTYAGGIMITYNGSAWANSSAYDLNFRLYANGQVATSEQMRSLINNFGQFVSSVVIGTASGITMGSYRDGETTALAEVEALMRAGTTNSRRYMSRVDEARRAWIEEEPASTAEPVYLEMDGKLTNLIGVEVPAQELPGRWCKLRDPIPLVTGATMLINPGLQFIERAKWSSSEGVRVEFRGQPGIEDF